MRTNQGIGLHSGGGGGVGKGHGLGRDMGPGT